MLKKYSITALFSLLLIFTGFTSGGFAQTPETVMIQDFADAKSDVEKVNEKIYVEIAKLQTKADKMYVDYQAELVKTADEQKHADAWNKYNVKVEAEIAKLQKKTETMTNKGIEKAIAAGLKVEIEWITVKFADRERDIDPIKVMDW